MGIERAGGGSVFVRRWGEGPRDAVLVHCALGHAGMLEGLAGHLSDVLSMTAFDLPGHGESAPWDGGEVQARAVAIAADLAGDGPVDLIGHSFGGTVALRLACERPELARSLTMIEPVFFSVLAADCPGLMAEHDAMIAPYDAAVARGDWPEAARLFTAIWGAGRPWEALSNAARAQIAARMPVVEAGSRAVMEDPARLVASGAVDRLAVPALLVEGAQTNVYIRAICARLAARLPDAVQAVIPGAGHMAPLTHPAETAAAIRGLLDRTG